MFDADAAALAQLKERPDLIDSWTRVVRLALSRLGTGASPFSAVLTQAAVDRAIDGVVDRLGEEWAGPNGAEAMLWYTASHQLAVRAGGGTPDFADPIATAARARAIDLLIEHSQRRPEDMRHWHWNSLAFAWARSGKISYAAGALERAEAALAALPADTEPAVLQAGVFRMVMCLGQAVGDLDAARASAERLVAAADRWPADAADAVLDTALGAMIQLGLNEPASAMLASRADGLDARPDGDDLRSEWLRLSQTAGLAGEADLEHRALLAVADEIDQHGEGPRGFTRNELGWRLRRAGDEPAAQRVWARWLADQERLVGADPDAGNLYNLACGLALIGRDEEALDALARAVAAGWSDVRHTASDRDLSTLRETDRFRSLLDRMATPSRAG
ncbi:MAG: hypothetical protein D6693_06835 [Planctomycetota bacterium]|nr:MAG: hypothetical protein D6693_06835 [Planctomycetota bacterium]